MAAFASNTDVSGTWRALSDAETAYADLLLDAAALWIRNRLPGILDSDPAARIVSIEVVRAALQKNKLEGLNTYTRTVGGRTESWTGARTATSEELARTLEFSEYHQQLLGIWKPKAGPRYTMGNAYCGVDPIRLPSTEWGIS
jgi:hypothetical protein